MEKKKSHKSKFRIENIFLYKAYQYFRNINSIILVLKAQADLM